MPPEVKDSRPPPPDWINKEFVQKALRSGDGDQTITVVSTEARMANPVGDGYASDMYRVTAQLQDGRTRSLIFKCHPQGGKREEMMRIWNGFSTEQNMLVKTLPAMSKLLEEVNSGKYPPFAARCIYHGDEPVKFLVLEDLRQLEFTLAKRQQGLDMSTCSLVMRYLARFHATSIALHTVSPGAVECYAESVYTNAMREHLGSIIRSSFKSVANEIQSWPDYGDKYAERIHQLADFAYDRLAEVTRRKERGCNVLSHSDLWTSNMMFKYNDGAVVDFRLVDFQTAHYSSPAIDLHYFLSTCPSEDVRTHNVDQLLQEYHTVLNQTLDELGCSQQRISLADLNKEFDERAFFGMFTSFMILPVVMSDPEDGFDFEQSLQGNHEHLESTKMIYSGEAYKRTLRTLLPLYESKGLI